MEWQIQMNTAKFNIVLNVAFDMLIPNKLDINKTIVIKQVPINIKNSLYLYYLLFVLLSYFHLLYFV